MPPDKPPHAARVSADGAVAGRFAAGAGVRLKTDGRFETLMLGLRMTCGVSESEFQERHGVSLDALYGEKLRKFEHEGLLQHKTDRWSLTRRGMDVQNAILVELMDD